MEDTRLLNRVKEETAPLKHEPLSIDTSELLADVRRDASLVSPITPNALGRRMLLSARLRDSPSYTNEPASRKDQMQISELAQKNPALRALLAMDLSPIGASPTPGTYRCFICWESTTRRKDVLVPCECRSDGLKYVIPQKRRMSYVFHLGPPNMHGSLGQ
jgi:hypothetical protein